VELGEGSGDLAVVACRSAKDVAWFRQHNPAFQNCLITLWNQWALLWLRSDAPSEKRSGDGGLDVAHAGCHPGEWPGQSQALIHTDEEPVQVCFAKFAMAAGTFRRLSALALSGEVTARASVDDEEGKF